MTSLLLSVEYTLLKAMDNYMFNQENNLRQLLTVPLKFQPVPMSNVKSNVMDF